LDYNTVTLLPYNEAFIKLSSDPGIEREIWEFFKFRVPNYKFDMRFKMGRWDGFIKLFNLKQRTIYKGLIPYVEKFCEEREYRIKNKLEEYDDEVSLVEIINFLKGIKVSLKPRDYQIKGIAHCLRRRRAVLVSPTASGKSFTIYSIIRWYNKRTLLIVPTTHLVHQMFGDFVDYSKGDPGWAPALQCSKVMAGASKENLNDIVISTWQSVINMSPEWLEQFEVVIVDEAHGAKAKSLVKIMEGCINAQYRIGFTGTLDGMLTHKLVLEGLFGPVKQVVETHELMERNYLAKLKIRCLLLNYHPEIAKKVPKKYPDEIKFLIEDEGRNAFISNLSASLEGNTLVLYQYVEKHGEILYNAIDKIKSDTQKVYFIHGGVSPLDREEYRKQIEASTGNIIVASYGTYSTGVNIININNIIFASPSKSRIRNLQSIGRGLRRGTEKEFCTLFDIADDMARGNYKNYSLKHFFERIKIYNEQRFEYTIHKIRKNT
jgi:superfamily II DNA or RNA helicase